MEADMGMMMQVQFAIMRPWSETGIKAKFISTCLRSRKGIQLSAATCLWLNRRITSVG